MLVAAPKKVPAHGTPPWDPQCIDAFPDESMPGRFLPYRYCAGLATNRCRQNVSLRGNHGWAAQPWCAGGGAQPRGLKRRRPSRTHASGSSTWPRPDELPRVEVILHSRCARSGNRQAHALRAARLRFLPSQRIRWSRKSGKALPILQTSTLAKKSYPA